ncbi:MAG: TraB family protein [Myxococcales bacterium]|nr:TraB family protein [Myxococcales bacterium]
MGVMESERRDAPNADDAPAIEVPSHVTVVARRDRTSGEERMFHIVGTAHVSKQSIEEVRRVIAEVRPDTVCVELCQARYDALTDPSRWRKLDVAQIIRERRVPFVMASLALQAFQRRIGERLGVRPGAELLAAVEAAHEIGAAVVLADRDVQATLRRTWHKLGLFRRALLVLALVIALRDSEELDEADVEALKDRKQIADAMSELARVMPEVKTTVIDERDLFLASRIEDTPGRVVVAVVGAGHVDGMLNCFGRSVDRHALSQFPRRTFASQALSWIVPILVALSVGWGLFRGHATVAEMTQAWVLPTACLGGLFTALAGGKLLSIVTATLLAPLGALVPFTNVGATAGLLEVWLRRPLPSDGEALGRDPLTLRGAWRNPLTRSLFVAWAATFGTTLGAAFAAVYLALRVLL